MMPSSSRSCEMSSLMFWLLSFSACSAGMLISNKIAVTDVPHPTLLVWFQLAFATLAILILPPLRNRVHFGSWQAAWTWATTVSLLFAGMLTSSLWSLAYASATVAVLVRNCAPILALAFETVYMPHERIVITLPIVGSLLMCLFGAKLYTLHSSPIGTLGVVFLLLNLFISVTDRSVARYYLSTVPLDISKTGLLLLNNAIALVPVTLLILSTESLPTLAHELPVIAAGLSHWAWANLLFSCVAGMGIGYTGFMLQSHVTASTFLVVTIANKAIVILIDGVALSKELQPAAWAGVFFSMAGSAAYGFALQTAEQTKERKPLLTGPPEDVPVPTPAALRLRAAEIAKEVTVEDA